MVSVSDYIVVVKDIATDQYWAAFVDAVFARIPEPIDFVRTADDCAVMMWRAIVQGDQSAFYTAFDFVGSRRPSKQSDWISNNLLLLAVLCGYGKFGVGKQWLEQVVTARGTDGSDEEQAITATLTNILYTQTEDIRNIAALAIVYKHIVGIPIIDGQYIVDAYKELMERDVSDSRSLFLRNISIIAIYVIVRTKGLIDPSRLQRLELFAQRMERFVHASAFSIWIGLVMAVGCISIWLLLEYLHADTRQADLIDRILGVFGATVGSVMPFLLAKKKIVANLQRFLSWCFHLPK